MSVVTSEAEFDRLPQTVQMRHDLQDPARRMALRERYKQGFRRSHSDIREQLQVTEAQEARLFDLLADFLMRHLDIFFTKESDPLAKLKRFQENGQRRDEALHSLLGPDTLEEYRRYRLEVPEREVVRQLSSWLDPANALSPQQKSQLIAVLKAQREQASREQDQRLLQSDRVASPANAAQLLEAESRRLLHHAASFLSAAQLAAMTKMENEKLEAQRRWVDACEPRE